MVGPEAAGGRHRRIRSGMPFHRGSRGWQVAFALMLALVVYGSLVPPSQEPGFAPSIPDWLQHGAAYAALMTTLLAGQRRPRYLVDACALFILGAVIEVLQGRLGYRVADARDLSADAVGIVLGGVIALLSFHRPARTHADN